MKIVGAKTSYWKIHIWRRKEKQSEKKRKNFIGTLESWANIERSNICVVGVQQQLENGRGTARLFKVVLGNGSTHYMQQLKNTHSFHYHMECSPVYIIG